MNQAQQKPTAEIQARLNNPSTKPKIGDKVVVTRADGSQYIAEITELHQSIKDWILKVKKVDDDGIITIEEVANLVVDAVIIVKDILLSDVFKTISQWLRNVFRKKDKKEPSFVPNNSSLF